jgi:putative multiple sugar transport system ATP-binding protein
MVSDMTLSENMMLKSSYLHRWDKGGWISWKTVDRYTQEKIDQYTIKAPDPSVTIGSLSGGNQQKVVLAKWMLTEPDVLILDEPTRGIDVGAKYEIYCVINELAKSGKAVIVISSEMPEIIGTCDRTYVINEGEIAGELVGDEITQEAIMARIMAHNRRKEEVEA